MSEFAKLLGKLETSANKAVESATSTNRKRPKPSDVNATTSDNEESKANRISTYKKQRVKDRQNVSVLPRDINDLTIKISFLGIGAQKAGTSWLHKMLSVHDNLSLPEQKEIHFWDWHRRKGLKWYSHQFKNPPQKKYKNKTKETIFRGEITPCYAVLEERHIREIKMLFPDVKLIFLARDMVDRAWSALLMELRNAVNGLDQGTFAQSDDQMDPKELERLNRESNPNKYDDDYFMDRLQHSTHSSRSNYAKSLRLWLKYFSNDQLLILDYNDVSKKPRELISSVCQHIGVDCKSILSSLSDEKLSSRVNAAAGSIRHDIRPSLRKKMEEYLKPFAQDFNVLLSELGYNWKLNDYSNHGI